MSPAKRAVLPARYEEPTVVTAVQTRTDLNNAVALLQAKGWCQGAFTAGGRSCLDGALRKVTGDAPFGPRYRVARSAVLRQLGLHLEDAEMPLLTQWNDVPGRTLAEVVEALRGAIRMVTS